MNRRTTRVAVWCVAQVFGLSMASAQAPTLAAPPVFDRPDGLALDLGGPLRRQVDGVVTNWLLAAPDKNPAVLGMFRDRDKQPPRDLLPWSGEFAGKYLTGGVEVLRLTRDARLRARLKSFVDAFVACQDADGYLGPFDKAHRLTGRAPNIGGQPGDTWDAWGHYHALVGLLLWHDETGDANAIRAARRAGDLLCATFPEAGKGVAATGSPEMNQAIVHALAMLYARTGERKYLDCAERVVADFASPGAGDYLRGALAGKDFFQLPNKGPRWESLHAIMGLAELYAITGNPKYRQAYEHLWWGIARTDRHNNGGFSSGEQARGNPYDRGAIETCCTIAWIAMGVEMLRMTGDPRVADELEWSTLNQVVALHAPDGAWCTYNTPMEGVRVPSTQDIAFQIRPGCEQFNCCSANAPRGFGMIADWALMRHAGGLVLNAYGPSTLTANVSGVPVKLTQATAYPRDARVELTIDPQRPTKFVLKLRIPHWSANTQLSVNGEPVPVAAGTYARLDREWKPGDRVVIDFDFAPRYWVGEAEFKGRASIFRGPLLLALDAPRPQPRFSEQFSPGGPLRVTDKAGAWVEYAFEGDAITWNGFRYDDGGKTRVRIDGAEVAVVDQYGPGRDLPFAWTRTGLGPGPHTIRLEVLGEKSAASKGTWANVRGLEAPGDIPLLDARALASAKIRTDDATVGLLVETKDTDGGSRVLRDYGTAGMRRTPYLTWFRVRNVPAAAAFSRENPSRTARAVR